MKKHSTHGSSSNLGSKSQKNVFNLFGSSGRPRISIQADKFLDKGYSAGGRHTTQVQFYVFSIMSGCEHLGIVTEFFHINSLSILDLPYLL